MSTSKEEGGDAGTTNPTEKSTESPKTAIGGETPTVPVAPEVRTKAKPKNPVRFDLSASFLYPVVRDSAVSLGWVLVNEQSPVQAQSDSSGTSKQFNTDQPIATEPHRHHHRGQTGTNASSPSDWNVAWHDQSISCKFLTELKSYQHINHFPGIIELNRKVRMARRLRCMKEQFPDAYSFAPDSWCLPSENTAVVDMISMLKQQDTDTNSQDGGGEHIFIVKPDRGSQAKGIFLYSTAQPLPPRFAASGEEVCDE